MKFIIWHTLPYFHTVHGQTAASSGCSYADWYCALIEPITSRHEKNFFLWTRKFWEYGFGGEKTHVNDDKFEIAPKQHE